MLIEGKVTEAKLIEAEAAVKLAETAAKRTVENAKEVQKEPSEKAGRDENLQDKDEASLSNQSRLQGLSETQLQKLEKLFSFEELEKAWMQLMNWIPSGQVSLAENLKQLSSLYQLLLNGILSNTEGSQQEEQIARLQQQLSAAFQKLSDSHIPGLTSFFGQYGTDNALPRLRNSLYQKVTGQTMAAGETQRFFQARDGEMPSSVLKYNVESSSGNRMHLRHSENIGQQGGIYKPHPDKGVPIIEHNTSAYMKASMPSNISVRETAAYNSSMPNAGKGLYTTVDIEKGEQFAKHLTGKGNLFTESELTSGNSELLGTVAAVTALKAEIFGNVDGISSNMAVSVKSAVEQMIDCYISKALNAEKKYTENTVYMNNADQSQYVKQDIRPMLSRKEVYNVYYYMLSAYQRKRIPEEAIKDGMKYAYSIFQAKRDSGDRKDGAAYPETMGFFFEKEKKDAPAGRRKGCKVLEKNWLDFLEAIQQGKDGQLSLEALEQSFWGVAAKPPFIPYEKTSPRFILAIIIIVIAAVVIASAWF